MPTTNMLDGQVMAWSESEQNFVPKYVGSLPSGPGSGYEPAIAPGSTSQYWRGDKTWATLDKASVGLGAVANSLQLVAANNLSDLASALAARSNLGVAIGSQVQAWDADLDALAALAATAGMLSRTAAGAFAARTLTAPAAGLAITNNTGAAGNPTFALADDLAALEALGSTGIAVRTGANAWAQRSLVQPASGITITNADGSAGNPTLTLSNDLAALEALAGTGLAVRTAPDAWAQRSIAAPAAGLSITNADGAAGNPTLALANDLAALEALGSTGIAVRTAPDAWAQRSLAVGAGLSLTNGDGVSGNPTLANTGVLSLTGTANRVTVSAATGAVTLSLPQDIHSGASPFFANLGVTGNFATGAVVSSLLPVATDTYDLGSSTKLWRKGWLSEMDAILFAQNTVTLVGGWLMATKNEGSVPVGQDVAAGDGTLDFGQAMTANDFVLFRAAGSVEYLQVGSLVSGTRYNVTRNLDGTGANAWPAGSVYAVLGNAGSGRIEINANATPRISLIKQGSTYNAQTEMVRIGDLNGEWGYLTETYGFAAGQFNTTQAWVTLEDVNGLRMGSGALPKLQINPNGSGYFANNQISFDTAGNLAIAGNATVAGWSVTASKIYKDEVALASGANPAFSALVGEAWLGKSVTGFYGLVLKGTTSPSMSIIAGHPSVGAAGRPYLQVTDGTRSRIVLGELNTTVWDGVGSNSMGLKIWAQDGSKIVEFSDVANQIAGWTISSSGITSGGITLAASASAPSNKIYVGAGAFNNTNTAFYVDGTGQLSLKDKLVWDGSTLTINGGGTFTGNLSAAGGTFAGSLSAATGTFTGTISVGAVILNTSGAYIQQGSAAVNSLNWYVTTPADAFSTINASRAFSTSSWSCTTFSASTSTNAQAQITVTSPSGTRDAHFNLTSDGVSSRSYAALGGTNSTDFLGIQIGANAPGVPTAMLDVRGTGSFTGAVAFSGGISGNVNFDSGTFYVDATNNRVGAGTASPGAVLDVRGDFVLIKSGATGPQVGAAFAFSTACPSGTIPWGLRQNAAESGTPTLAWFETSDGNLGYIGARSGAIAFGGFTSKGLQLLANNATQVTISSAGTVGIGTTSPTISGSGRLHLVGDTLRLDTARTPATSGATGNVGEICWDADYVYICVATNTWHRAAHATW